MKFPPYIAGFLSAVCLALLIGAAAPEPPRPQITTHATVTNIVDGDTLDVVIQIPVRVRLLDCWAPESRTKNDAEKKLGLASKEHIKELAPIGAKCVVTFPLDGEVLTLGRVLGYVNVNGLDLSTAQCAAGHATRERTK